VTTGVVSVVSMKTTSRPAWSLKRWRPFGSHRFFHDDQRGPRVARDAHDQEQQLLADIVMTSVVVGSSPPLNTPMLQEGIAGQR
jgi:hypothetical protein